MTKIFGLAENPRPRGSIKLRAQAGFRLRVGDYRVVYDVDEVTQTLSVLRIRHRREAYR